MPPCWRAGWEPEEKTRCAACGGRTEVEVEPNSGDPYWLCMDAECGALTNADGVAVDIAPVGGMGGGDYLVDQERERGTLRERQREREAQKWERAHPGDISPF